MDASLWKGRAKTIYTIFRNAPIKQACSFINNNPPLHCKEIGAVLNWLHVSPKSKSKFLSPCVRARAFVRLLLFVYAFIYVCACVYIFIYAHTQNVTTLLIGEITDKGCTRVDIIACYICGTAINQHGIVIFLVKLKLLFLNACYKLMTKYIY